MDGNRPHGDIAATRTVGALIPVQSGRSDGAPASGRRRPVDLGLGDTARAGMFARKSEVIHVASSVESLRATISEINSE